MNFLEKLRKEDPASAVAFHLEGLLEAQDNIRSLLTKLGEDATSDPENAAETMICLQVEIYTHLSHNLKELRRPLKRLVDAAYKELPDFEEEEGLEWFKRRLSQLQAEAGAKHAKQRGQ
jgi:hypothetical protein